MTRHSAPLRWRRRPIVEGQPRTARGWVLLTANGTGGPRYINVDSNGLEPRLELKRNESGGPSLLIRLPNQDTILRLIPVADDEDGVNITEIGWLQAYPRLFWNTAHRLIADTNGRPRALRIALTLLRNGQFAEIRRRILRRSESIDAAPPIRGPASFAASARIRRRKTDAGPIRAVMCTHTLNRDGAPISLFELTAELARRKIIDPVVVSPRDGPLRKDYEARNIPVVIHDSGVEQALNLPGYDHAIAGFCDCLESHSADLVFANTARTFFAIDAADQLHLPNVWNLRESEAGERHFEAYSSAVQGRAAGCLARTDRLIFVAEATRAAWGPFPGDANAVVIRNALDPTRFQEAGRSWTRKAARDSLGIESDAVSLVCVGTICRRKGQLDLIEAASRIPEAILQHLWIDLIGARDAAYERELRQKLDSLAEPVRARIRLHDETALVARHYAGADIFVCTSRSESYPRVILEAMAHGLAIVTTPAGGIREQLSDAESGLFYDPGNVGALAARIAELAANPARREGLGRAALQAHDKKSNFSNMIRQYADVIRQVCIEDSAS